MRMRAIVSVCLMAAIAAGAVAQGRKTERVVLVTLDGTR